MDRFDQIGHKLLDTEGKVYLVITSLMVTLLSLVLPLFVLIMFDRVIPNEANETLWLLFTFVICVIIFDYWIKDFEEKYITSISRKFEEQVNKELFSAFCHANLDEYLKVESGEYIERIAEFSYVKNFYTGESIKAFVNWFSCGTIILVLAYINSMVAFVLLLASIALYQIAKKISHLKVQKLKERTSLEGKTNSKIIEIISHPHLLKSSAMEYRLENKMSSLIEQREDKSIGFEKLETSLSTSLSFIQQISICIVVFISALYVMNAEMSQGVMAAIILLCNRYFSPYQQAINTISKRDISKVYINQLKDILKLSKTENRFIKLVEVPFIEVVVGFDMYMFERQKVYLLRGDISSGKTRMLQAIASVHVFDDIQVSMDGLPIDSFNYDNWRSKVSLVDQNSRLIEGTIIDNITCFRPKLNKAAYTLCEALNIKHVIDQLPYGFYTEVTSKQIPLPRQVIYALCVIRALLSRPEVLLLDDIDTVAGNSFLSHVTESLLARKDSMICILVSNKTPKHTEGVETVKIYNQGDFS